MFLVGTIVNMQHYVESVDCFLLCANPGNTNITPQNKEFKIYIDLLKDTYTGSSVTVHTVHIHNEREGKSRVWREAFDRETP